jgi:hypothetical protein
MARAVGSATCFRGMDHRWIRVPLGAVCHAELGAAFPKAGGPTSISAGVSALCGDFSFAWMSSLLVRPAGMATLATGFVRFLDSCFLSWPRLYSQPSSRLGFTLQQGPNAGGFDGGGRYGYELLQCADEWRDLGSTYVRKWIPGTGTYAVNPDCAAHARES